MDQRVAMGRRSEVLSGRHLSRRAFIGMAAGSVLASYSTAAAASSSPRTRTAGDHSELPDSDAPNPSSPRPSAEARTAEPFASEVTRAEIVTRYAGVAPVAWGLDVPGVVNRLPTQNRVVALTFDACGGGRGSGYDAALMEALRVTGTPATLFLNERWVLAHPEVTAELAGQPLFEIANHGTQHRPLSVTGRSAYGITGTADAGEVYDEVCGNRQSLTEAVGVTPRFFRSGTAHYDDVAVRIAGELGAVVVNFDVNGDAGATLTPQEVVAALESAASGSIVLCHMNQPDSGTAQGVATALPRLAQAGFRFVHLSDYL
jgi:peptidoglycan/xylan/chitin deacetylase (PgdA/CDA1 family)